MAKRYRSGWWLTIKYHEEGWTQREIAELCDVSPRTIRKYMDEYDIETRDVEGENHGLYGEERDDAVREQISRTLTGRELSETTIKRRSETVRGRELPVEVREKISDSLTGITRSVETREKMSKSTAGERNPNWRGGYSPRYGAGWATAREAALERDDVCQQCGTNGSDRRLEVHHIVPVRRFREAPNSAAADAHALGNLVVLCSSCHPKADHGVIEFESTLADPGTEGCE